jgi:hypothetical protein
MAERGDAMAASRRRFNEVDRQVEIAAELVDEHVELDDDVVELDAETWAIHGRIAYEGEVIAATFSTEEGARAELDRLHDVQARPPDAG